MSYEQMMKWSRKHRKGISHNYMGFACSSSFWPSTAFLEEDYWPYLKQCKIEGIKPMGCEEYYKTKLI